MHYVCTAAVVSPALLNTQPRGSFGQELFAENEWKNTNKENKWTNLMHSFYLCFCVLNQISCFFFQLLELELTSWCVDQHTIILPCSFLMHLALLSLTPTSVSLSDLSSNQFRHTHTHTNTVSIVNVVLLPSCHSFHIHFDTGIFFIIFPAFAHIPPHCRSVIAYSLHN